jgi:GNAT superfamily N-acetyltransferase
MLQIYDQKELAAYFREDLPLHAYSLGDLDDFHWPHTTYYGIKTDRCLKYVVLLYKGEGLPVLIALGTNGIFNQNHLNLLHPLLPDSFNAHLSPGLEKLFASLYDIQDFGPHYKMSLEQPSSMEFINSDNTFRLTEKHLPEMLSLYEISYPDNAFDPRMLSTGKYIGQRDSGRLVAIAGVHVFSSQYRVATLGNITTHPDFRDQGLARVVIARLCRDLVSEVDFIGLNVKSSNLPALRLYQSLGFKIHSKDGEFCLKRG